jgi:hypothetical protein
VPIFEHLQQTLALRRTGQLEAGVIKDQQVSLQQLRADANRLPPASESGETRDWRKIGFAGISLRDADP